jgi:hypothetical protein
MLVEAISLGRMTMYICWQDDHVHLLALVCGLVMPHNRATLIRRAVRMARLATHLPGTGQSTIARLLMLHTATLLPASLLYGCNFNSI